MSSGTLLITGPTRVALWLYMHTGGAKTVLSWAKDMGIPESAYDTHLKLAQLVAQFQNVVVGPHITQPSIVQRYGFPLDYARINSEASWIK